MNEASVGIDGAHIAFLQAVGNDGYILEELVKDGAMVIVIGLNRPQCRGQRDMGLDITTTIDVGRVVIHELNLGGAVVGTVTVQFDLETCNGFQLNLGIEFLGASIQGRSRLCRVFHEPVAVDGLLNIGLSCEAEGEVQTGSHIVVMGRLSKDVTNLGEILRNRE